ncbi:hypothetical protein BT69DRAFT_208786 [Atractiella rhizophila]|nr:hypothetical protein BT69DRAFT_208786 [Atractiella rhizophila]
MNSSDVACVGTGDKRQGEDEQWIEPSPISKESSDLSDVDYDEGTVAPAPTANQDRTPSAARRSATSTGRRKRKPEGLEDDDDDDDDEDFEDGDATVGQKRKRSHSGQLEKKRKASEDVPTRKPSISQTAGAVGLVEETNKARVHVLNELKKLLLPLLPDELKAEDFARHLETQILISLGEVSKGLKAPGGAYKNRFSLLKKHLETNDDFKSRITSGELDPTTLANMPAEEMDPALRAYKEKLYEQSLKVTVKEALAQPKVKRTHKGEELLEDSFQAGPSSIPTSTVPSNDVELAIEAPPSPGTLQSPLLGTEEAQDTAPQLFRRGTSSFAKAGDEPTQPQPLRRGSSSTIAPTDEAEHSKAMVTDTATFMTTITEDPEEVTPADADEDDPILLSRTSTADRPNFDLSTVWDSIKTGSKPSIQEEVQRSRSPSTTPEYDPEKAGEKDEKSGVEDFDPFAPMEGVQGYNDKDLNYILGQDEPMSTTPPNEPPPLPEPDVMKLDDLPIAYKGDVSVPDETDYPYQAIQVGGRYLGDSNAVWEQLLPRTFISEGRVPVPDAMDFFFKCLDPAGAKELFVTAFLPDQLAANYRQRTKDALESLKHIVGYFQGRKRVGVMLTPKTDAIRRHTKEIYLVPLLPQDPLPKFLEKIEGDNILSTIGKRSEPLLLGVIVAAKGVFKTVPRPPKPMPTITGTSTFDPIAISELIKNTDLKALAEALSQQGGPSLDQLMVNPTLPHQGAPFPTNYASTSGPFANPTPTPQSLIQNLFAAPAPQQRNDLDIDIPQPKSTYGSEGKWSMYPRDNGWPRNDDRDRRSRWGRDDRERDRGRGGGRDGGWGRGRRSPTQDRDGYRERGERGRRGRR